jgi:hypothetical protein
MNKIILIHCSQHNSRDNSQIEQTPMTMNRIMNKTHQINKEETKMPIKKEEKGG